MDQLNMDVEHMLTILHFRNNGEKWSSPDPFLSDWIKGMSLKGKEIFTHEMKAELNRLELKNSHGSTKEPWESPSPHITKFLERFEALWREIDKSGTTTLNSKLAELELAYRSPFPTGVPPFVANWVKEVSRLSGLNGFQRQKLRVLLATSTSHADQLTNRKFMDSWVKEFRRGTDVPDVKVLRFKEDWEVSPLG